MAKRRGKNEGSIFQRANGTWRAQVSIDGKRAGHTARTRAECHEWLRKMLDQIDQGLTFESRNLILNDYLKEWITLKKTVLRPRSGFQYERLIDLYIRPGLGKTKLKDLNLRVINRFYASMIDKGIGTWNIRYTHRVLHAALEQAVKNGILGRNPTQGATVPKMKYKEMNILNEQQVGLFLVAASNSRYNTLYHLAITTGMRFSELRGLCWSDVNWVRGSIVVRRQIQDVEGITDRRSQDAFRHPHDPAGSNRARQAQGTAATARRRKNGGRGRMAGERSDLPIHHRYTFLQDEPTKGFRQGLAGSQPATNSVSRPASYCRKPDAQPRNSRTGRVENLGTFESKRHAQHLCALNPGDAKQSGRCHGRDHYPHSNQSTRSEDAVFGRAAEMICTQLHPIFPANSSHPHI